MPVPLFWLAMGAAALGTYSQFNTDKRLENAGQIKKQVLTEGSIVCCGVYGVFNHVGIWTKRGIVELKGDGLVRQVSPERFLSRRSGEYIYVASNDKGGVLSDKSAAKTAVEQLFQYRDYHVTDNNCYRFVWPCLTGETLTLKSFRHFEQQLQAYFQCQIHWLLLN